MIHKSDHERLSDSLPAYVLGALTDQERIEVEDHLDVCPVCSGEYDELAEAGMILALNVPPREPPARLKRRLMERVDKALSSPAVPDGPRYDGGHRTRFARVATIAQRPKFRYAAAAVAAVAIGAFAASLTVILNNNSLGERVHLLENQAAMEATAVSAIAGNMASESETVAESESTIETVSRLAAGVESLQEIFRESITLMEDAADPNTRTAFLESADGPDGAVGTLVANITGTNNGVLLISGLEPSPPGFVYQLWLNIGGVPRSVITFRVDDMGNALIALPMPFFPSFPVGAVTLEPGGGSLSPTGTEVLRLSGP